MHSPGSFQKLAAGLAILPLSFGMIFQPANAITPEDIRGLTYSQVKGTGMANRCPEASQSGKEQEIVLSDGVKYKVVDFCLEPKSFQIEQETEKRKGVFVKNFVDARLLTRATYSLSGMEGPLTFDKDGVPTFTELDGMDYAAITLQLPGGERVPFLFTVKGLQAKATGTSTIAAGTELNGIFRVPSYRSGLFLDPKGRGGTNGYDQQPGLWAMSDSQESIFKENNKVYQVTDGLMEMAVNKADGATGEFSGVFVSEQLSDSDMGARTPKKVLLKGIMYGHILPADGTENY